MLFTAQYRYVPVGDEERLDITVANGVNDPIGKFFAPTWDMVRGFKNGRLSETSYTRQYYELVNKRFSDIPEMKTVIEELFNKTQNKDIVMVCFCKSGDFCHRLLAADWLVRKFNFKYGGEKGKDMKKQDKVLMVTGHRQIVPVGHIGSPWPNRNQRVAAHYATVVDAIKEVILRAIGAGFKHFVTGMALGADQLFAWAVLDLKLTHNITLTAALPFENQSAKWIDSSKKEWEEILRQADFVHVVTKGGYSPEKMQLRNEWMVRKSDAVLAIYSGIKSGGTYNCIKYAKGKRLPILIMHPSTLNAQWVLPS